MAVRDHPPDGATVAQWEREWLDQGVRRHLIAIGLLSLVALALYHRVLLRTGEFADETIYVAAARAVATGESPFQVPGYYYPAAFAYLWAATEKASAIPAWLAWRLANLAAAILLVWLAGIHFPVDERRWWLRPLLCAPLLAAPGISLALRTGNVSVLTALLVAAGVLLAGHRPLRAGLLLGASVAIKPLAVPALVALATPGVRRSRSGGAPPLSVLGPEQRASALGLALAALVLFAVPFSRELLTQPVEVLSTIRTVSFERLFRLLGLPLPRFAVLAIVYVALAAAASWWTRDRIERAVVALAGAMCAAPLVWSHTLILGLPFLTLALAVHWPDLARDPASDLGNPSAAVGRRRRLTALAVLALVALQLFLQPGGFDHYAVAVQVALSLPMLAAPPLTAALLIRRMRSNARRWSGPEDHGDAGSR
ncbi:MAG TPA: glycosyltransferase family 87 protein [Thermoanaerobaculia bacterium]|nr:glycosyltransferase family 87 protein [Thermoanaerobaculia bacterium]